MYDVKKSYTNVPFECVFLIYIYYFTIYDYIEKNFNAHFKTFTMRNPFKHTHQSTLCLQNLSAQICKLKKYVKPYLAKPSPLRYCEDSQ